MKEILIAVLPLVAILFLLDDEEEEKPISP